MRYGQPKVFAIESVVRLLWARFRVDLDIAFEFHRRIGAKTATILGGLTLFLGSMISLGIVADAKDTGDDVFGHYALFSEYQGRIDQQPGAPQTLRVATVIGLTQGHRCAEREVVQANTTGRCLSKNATPLPAPVSVSKGWKATCCIRVVPGSDQESLSGARRAFLSIGIPLNGGFFAALAVAIGTAVVTAIVAGLAVILVTPVTALVLFGLTFGSNVAAIVRLFTSMRMAGRRLRVHPWPETSVATPLLVQITDLHVAEKIPYELQVDPEAFTEGESLPGGHSLDSRLTTVLRATEDFAADAIALTGDITDSGSQNEWKRFIEIWDSVFPESAAKLVAMVPGNHDISFNVGECPDPEGTTKTWKERRFLDAEAHVSGRDRSERKIEDYPFFDTIAFDGEHINVLTLNSCRYDSHFILSNAIGKIGQHQLNSLSGRLQSIVGPLVVLVHHHIALQNGRLSILRPLQSAQELLKLPVDARELMALLTEYAKLHPVLVLHGHQHENLRFCIDGESGGRLHVFGLASSTLGCVQFETAINRHALDGKLRVGLIEFTRESGWRAEARVVSASQRGIEGS